MTSDDVHRFNVLLEEIRGSVKFIAEGHGILAEQVGQLSLKQDSLAAKQDEMAAKQDDFAAKQDALATRVDGLSRDVRLIKTHLKLNGGSKASKKPKK